MRYVVFAAVFLLAIGNTAASEPGQPETTESPTPPAAAQSKATSEVRQAENSDLIVKEWRSPITFDLNAGWLQTLPFDKKAQITDLPAFYCDGVTLIRMSVTKTLHRKTGVVDVEIEILLRARKAKRDKVVALEFTLLNAEQTLRLGHVDDLRVANGLSAQTWITYQIAKEAFATYTADGSSPLLRVAMIVQEK